MIFHKIVIVIFILFIRFFFLYLQWQNVMIQLYKTVQNSNRDVQTA